MQDEKGYGMLFFSDPRGRMIFLKRISPLCGDAGHFHRKGREMNTHREMIGWNRKGLPNGH